MTNNPNLQYIFPTPLWSYELDIDLEKMEAIVNEFALSNPGRQRTNRGARNYQSPDLYAEDIITESRLEGDEFRKLLIKIKEHAIESFSASTDLFTLEYSNVWMNINGTGGYNEVHTHPSSTMSGVFYVKVPSGEAGDLVIHRNPLEAFVMNQPTSESFDDSTPHTSSNYAIPPVPGLLLLFPSYLSHSVRENKTEDNRISISFNFNRVQKRRK